jgi:hypothetical protein
MWERGLGHDEPHRLCPQPPSSFYIRTVRQGPTTISRLAPPIRVRDRTGLETWSHSVGRPLGSIQQIDLPQKVGDGQPAPHFLYERKIPGI